MLRTGIILITCFCTAPLVPVAADVVTPNGTTIPCYCTDSTGGRVELGDKICLHVDGRSFTAQCQMSLNVPMWRELHEGCVSSRLLPERRKPSIDTRFIDPKV